MVYCSGKRCRKDEKFNKTTKKCVKKKTRCRKLKSVRFEEDIDEFEFDEDEFDIPVYFDNTPTPTLPPQPIQKKPTLNQELAEEARQIKELEEARQKDILEKYQARQKAIREKVRSLGQKAIREKELEEESRRKELEEQARRQEQARLEEANRKELEARSLEEARQKSIRDDQARLKAIREEEVRRQELSRQEEEARRQELEEESRRQELEEQTRELEDKVRQRKAALVEQERREQAVLESRRKKITKAKEEQVRLKEEERQAQIRLQEVQEEADREENERFFQERFRETFEIKHRQAIQRLQEKEEIRQEEAEAEAINQENERILQKEKPSLPPLPLCTFDERVNSYVISSRECPLSMFSTKYSFRVNGSITFYSVEHFMQFTRAKFYEEEYMRIYKNPPPVSKPLSTRLIQIPPRTIEGKSFSFSTYESAFRRLLEKSKFGKPRIIHNKWENRRKDLILLANLERFDKQERLVKNLLDTGESNIYYKTTGLMSGSAEILMDIRNSINSGFQIGDELKKAYKRIK